MNRGWKWVMGLLAIFPGAIWILGSLVVPETYAPVILRRRAAKLFKITGKVYRSKLEMDHPVGSIGQVLFATLCRPWVLLVMEPIVLALSIYMAIIYGTLYLMFAAFPIVYQQKRHWNEGVGGLAFLGVLVGELMAVAYAILANHQYIKVQKKYKGFAPPEARMPLVIISSVLVPVGLFWFAWTNSPSVHFMASIAAGAPFGAGMVLMFLGIINYLVDAYTIYAASCLAANSVLRSLFGMAFPLFTTYMYRNLGIHWASSIPAFLAVACAPFPLLFYVYGARIRKYCKYSAESDRFMQKLIEQTYKGRQDNSQAELRDEDSTGPEGDENDKEKDLEKGLDRASGDNGNADTEGENKHKTTGTDQSPPTAPSPNEGVRNSAD